jgi:hypothetical protein
LARHTRCRSGRTMHSAGSSGLLRPGCCCAGRDEDDAPVPLALPDDGRVVAAFYLREGSVEAGGPGTVA